MYFNLMYFTLCTMHLTRCTSLDDFTLMYFTLCTMHLIRCTSLDVLHSDFDALHSMYFTLMYFTLCTYSEGLRTEEPFAKLSGKILR